MVFFVDPEIYGQRGALLFWDTRLAEKEPLCSVGAEAYGRKEPLCVCGAQGARAKRTLVFCGFRGLSLGFSKVPNGLVRPGSCLDPEWTWSGPSHPQFLQLPFSARKSALGFDSISRELGQER